MVDLIHSPIRIMFVSNFFEAQKLWWNVVLQDISLVVHKWAKIYLISKSPNLNVSSHSLPTIKFTANESETHCDECNVQITPQFTTTPLFFKISSSAASCLLMIMARTFLVWNAHRVSFNLLRTPFSSLIVLISVWLLACCISLKAQF